MKNKWELMGQDEHLQVRVVSNILNQSVGASNYANDRSDTNRTLLCRTNSREERLDLKALVSQKMPSIAADRKEEATHVVVGVYCGTWEKLDRIHTKDILKNHRLFSPSKLKRWLFYETTEVKMMEELVTGDDISLAPEFLDPKPTSCGKKFILLPFVPSLNEMARGRDVISEMEDYVEDLLVLLPSSPHEADDYSQDGDKSEDEEEKDGIAFKTAEHKRKLLQSNIRQLAEHIERNKGFDSNPVQYFVATDRDQETKFCHLLYDFSQSEENPEKTYWFELPKRPTNVQIQPELTDKIKRAKTTSTSIRIEWDYKQNEDFPCYFLILVDYRPKGNVKWARKKTNETHLAIDIDSAVESRVAAGCCVGLGPHADVIDGNAMEDDWRTAETPTSHKQPQITEGPSVLASIVVLSTGDVQM